MTRGARSLAGDDVAVHHGFRILQKAQQGMYKMPGQFTVIYMHIHIKHNVKTNVHTHTHILYVYICVYIYIYLSIYTRLYEISSEI